MIPETEGKQLSSAVFDHRFEILSTVGRGRNSIVYKARILAEPDGDPRERRRNGGTSHRSDIVAIKVLTGNSKNPEQNVIRMKREALAMLSARHKNVIRLNDYVTSGELCYLSMELAEQNDLKLEIERREKPFSTQAALEIIRQVLAGLEEIHRVGIIHRDLKPENLMLSSDGVVKIGDFGIARLPVEEIPPEQLSRGVGTLEYLAPEALDRNIINEGTDLYSVGVTLYQLLTRHYPFGDGTLSEQLKRKLSGKRTPLSEYLEEVPPLLEQLLDRAIAPSPEARFQSAAQFREAIEAFLAGTWEPPVQAEAAPTVAKKLSFSKLKTDRVTFQQVKQVAGQLSQLPIALKITRLRQGVPASETDVDISSSRKLPLLLGVTAIGLMVGILLSFEKENEQGADEVETLSRQEAPAETAPSSQLNVTYIPTGRHVGVLYNFFAPKSHLVFSIERGDETGLLLLTLALSGSETVPVDISQLGALEEISLETSGLRIGLEPDMEMGNLPGNVVRGRFKDYTTGRSGEWMLW